MEETATLRQKSLPATGSFVPPYPPSWLDRFTAWVDRLPGAPWLFYVIVAGVLTLVLSAIQWREGSYPVGAFDPDHVFTATSLVYIVALMHFLDRSASSAMISFSPLLTSDEPESSRSHREQPDSAILAYRLTTLPPRPALLVTLVGAASAALALGLDTASGRPLPNFTDAADTALATASYVSIFIAANGVMFLLVYHTMHQLALISRIYSRYARINIYHLQPLYALSPPTAYTAIGLMLFIYGMFGIEPEDAASPIQLGLTVVFTGVALATFALPLLGAHRRLVAAKNARLAEVASRFEETTAELHRELDLRRFDQMDALNKALTNLEIEENALRKIPTWPWQPGTVRAVVAALLLPVAVWAIQVLLGRVLGL